MFPYVHNYETGVYNCYVANVWIMASWLVNDTCLTSVCVCVYNAVISLLPSSEVDWVAWTTKFQQWILILWGNFGTEQYGLIIKDIRVSMD